MKLGSETLRNNRIKPSKDTQQPTSTYIVRKATYALTETLEKTHSVFIFSE